MVPPRFPFWLWIDAHFRLHIAVLFLELLHLALDGARPFGYKLAVGARLRKFLVHFLKPLLDSLVDLFHVAMSCFHGFLLFGAEALHQALVLRFHHTKLLAKLFALLARLLRVETGARSGAGHIAGLFADTVHGLIAGSKLIALLVGGVDALAIAVAGGCARFTRLPVFLWRTALPARLPTAASLRPRSRQRQRQ